MSVILGYGFAAAWTAILAWSFWPNIKNSKTIQHIKELGWWLCIMCLWPPLSVIWNALGMHGWALVAANALWIPGLYWSFRTAHLRGQMFEMDRCADQQVARMEEDLRKLALWQAKDRWPTD